MNAKYNNCLNFKTKNLMNFSLTIRGIAGGTLPLFAAFVIRNRKDSSVFGAALQMRWRQSCDRWTSWSALYFSSIAVAVLFASTDIRGNVLPVVEMHSLKLACAIIDATHSFWAALGNDGPEGGWFWFPAQTMWIQNVKTKVRRTLQLGTVNSLFGA